MALHLQRDLMLLSVLLLLLLQWQRIHAIEDTPLVNSQALDDDDDDDSSSEETVEDSNEAQQQQQRKRREAPEEHDTFDGPETRASLIPGLPDPATIVKIAEIVQAVGNKVLPLLTQGVSSFAFGRPHFETVDNSADDLSVEAATDDASDVTIAGAVAQRQRLEKKNLQFLRMFKRRLDNFITAHRATDVI